jgi:hypothetical protein
VDLKRFENDRKIDPAGLDLAAATQAEVFFYWAQKSIEAKMAQDKAKQVFDLIESRLKLQARAEPERFGLTKVTEASLDEVVKTQNEYLKGQEDHFKAREESLLLEVVVQALEQRKRMIEVMVTLHGQQYFAGPSVPHDLVATWHSYQESRREKLTDVQKQVSRKRPATVTNLVYGGDKNEEEGKTTS